LQNIVFIFVSSDLKYHDSRREILQIQDVDPPFSCTHVQNNINLDHS
jgi:hypothetical protein